MESHGLFDKHRLQKYWLDVCNEADVKWHIGTAEKLDVGTSYSSVVTSEGSIHKARLVIDATGYKPVFLSKKNELKVKPITILKGKMYLSLNISSLKEIISIKINIK